MPRFDRALRLPIGRETLAARLALLPSADAAEIALAQSFLLWQRPHAARNDEDLVREYERVVGVARTRALRELIEYRLALRSVVAALRRRRLGRPPPRPGERWGVGPWVAPIERHYRDPDFGLQHRLVWLPTARRLVDAGDAVGLERLLFDLVWNALEGLAAPDRFGFPALLAYVFKWDLVDRWLRRGGPAASARLDALARGALIGLDAPTATTA